MGTNIDFDRVKDEIENLKMLYAESLNKYDKFIESVYTPMRDEKRWRGLRHDRNLAEVEKIKKSYEEFAEKIRSQINYLEYAYTNYKSADEITVKTINEWASQRLEGSDV